MSRSIGWMLTSLLVLSTACVSLKSDVQHESLADTDLTRMRTVRVTGPVAIGVAPKEYPSAIDRSLRQIAEQRLREKGFEVSGAQDSDLNVVIEIRSERVARRTWSSDPDASAYRLVELDEAVVVLKAFDTANLQIWRAVSRSRLPDREIFFAPSREEIWTHALEQALAVWPSRTAEAG